MRRQRTTDGSLCSGRRTALRQDDSEHAVVVGRFHAPLADWLREANLPLHPLLSSLIPDKYRSFGSPFAGSSPGRQPASSLTIFTARKHSSAVTLRLFCSWTTGSAISSRLPHTTPNASKDSVPGCPRTPSESWVLRDTRIGVVTDRRSVPSPALVVRPVATSDGSYLKNSIFGLQKTPINSFYRK